jgi:hypothetical protein
MIFAGRDTSSAQRYPAGKKHAYPRDCQKGTRWRISASSGMRPYSQTSKASA